MRLTAIDPGDIHVGVALWSGEDPPFVGTREVEPRDLPGLLRSLRPTHVVYEQFHLYPWSSEAQTFSQMPTSQLIGQIELVARDQGATVHSQQSMVLKIIRKTPYYKRHVERYGKPRNPHEESALCHGLFYLHMAPGGPNLE